MIKKKILFGIIATVLILSFVGIYSLNNESKINEIQKIPNFRENPEAFVCNTDSDCIVQQTSCNNCACPLGINKNYAVKINCEENNQIGFCQLYCPQSTPRCVNNSCKMVPD